MSNGTTIERRRYKRVPLALPVRFLSQATEISGARVVDISLGGAAIASPFRPRLGDMIVAYIDCLERFEATVVRLFRGGFAVRFDIGKRKLERLSEKLTYLSNQKDLKLPTELRRSARSAGKKTCVCRYPGGVAHDCQIVDFSTIGASLDSKTIPPIGAVVKVGKADAKVVRHTERGFAVEFSSYWEALPPFGPGR